MYSIIERQAGVTSGGDCDEQFNELRDLHSSVCKFLTMLLSGAISKSELQKENLAIKKSLKRIMSLIGAPAVLRFIMHDIHKTTDKIERDTEGIDHVKDAASLR